MDLRFAKLQKMRIALQSDSDLHLDLNTAEDLDMDGFSFFAPDEGDDLSDVMADPIGNYDNLDIDSDDLEDLPEPDDEALADSELEGFFLDSCRKESRADGAGKRAMLTHHEHLRESAKEKEVGPEPVLVAARKAMMAGVRDDALLRHLASKFDRSHLMVAADELKSYGLDQYLLGNVILEPELFSSCNDMEEFLSNNKVASTAKLAKSCGECKGCPYRKKSYCQKFSTTLVSEMPDSEKVFQHYTSLLRDAGLLPDVAVEHTCKKANNYKEATAAIFSWVEKAPKERKQAVSAAPSVKVPERRAVKQTPREQAIKTIGKMLGTGARVEQVKSATLSYLGKTPFEGIAREAISRRGSMPWSSFADCEHPLLMDKAASFELEPGEDCSGCIHNYGTVCGLNGRKFTQSFSDYEKYEEVPELMGEDEEFFLDSDPVMDVSPSVSEVSVLEPDDIEGLDEGFEV